MQRGSTTSPGYGKRCRRAEKEDRSSPVVNESQKEFNIFSCGNGYSYSVAVIIVGVLAPRNVDLGSSKYKSSK